MSGDQLMFKKESSLARTQMNLERLFALRERARMRLAVMRDSKIFAPSDIRYVESSILDLSQRIDARKSRIERIARRSFLKEADFLGAQKIAALMNG